METEAKKNKLVWLTPVCFALFPVLSLYAHNMSSVPFSDVLQPMGMAVGIALAAFIALAIGLKNPARAATLASIAVFLYFFQPQLEQIIGPFDNDFDRTLYAICYPIGALAIMFWLWRVTAKVHQVNQIVTVLGVTLFLTSGVAVGQNWYRIRQDLIAAEKAAYVGFDAHKQPVTKPDIFYIILDGYGRSDALEKYMKFDNSAFIKGLEQKGFYVAPLTRTNYCHTLISLATSMNMRYFHEMAPDLDPKGYNNAVGERLILKNRVARFLRQQGYEYVSINSSSFAHVDANHVDLLLPKAEQVNSFQAVLDPKSEAGLAKQLENYRKRVYKSIDSLNQIATPGEKPRFVFVHLMPPHPPFVFNADGTPREPAMKFTGINEGPAFREQLGDKGIPTYQEGYAQGATFVQNAVTKAVDSILKQAKTPPIIIIQGDHGSRSRMDHHEVSETEIDEVFPILNAYLVPKEMRDDLYPTISPVNSFPLILNHLFDTRLPLQEDRQYFSGFWTPFDFTEVTDKLAKEPLTK